MGVLHFPMEKYFFNIRKVCFSGRFVLHLQHEPLKITNMENMKLYSVRLDPRDVKTLEEAAKSESFYGRSDFLRAAVSLMAILCKEGRYGKVLAFRPRYGDVLDTFELTYHREHK